MQQDENPHANTPHKSTYRRKNVQEKKNKDMTTDYRDLIKRYFDGISTPEEEERLHHYFVDTPERELSDDLKPLAPLFHFIEEERTALMVLQEIKEEEKLKSAKEVKQGIKIKEEKGVNEKRPFLVRRAGRHRTGRIPAIAAAAAILLAVIMLVTRPEKEPTVTNGSYAWVNGVKITDSATVQKYAEIAFGKVKSDLDIFEAQLKLVLE